MNPIEVTGLLVIVLLGLGWRLTWLATRVDRAHHRVERAWAALDAALVRRAQRVAEVAGRDDLDPATALLLSDSAAAVLEPDLDADQREAAESDLSHVIEVVGLDGVADEQERASLGRRLHNDAVTTARALRSRPTVRIFRLAGHAPPPRAFEMADPRGAEDRHSEALGWARDR